MQIKHLILLLLSVSLYISCDSGLIYSHTESIEGAKWEYGEILEFDLIAEDTTKYYELVVRIDHNTDFSFENFYTKITTEFPDATELSDIVSFQLADKMGSWLGDCNSSNCINELILQEQFRFKQIGPHKIKLENYSRKALEGINAIELKLYDYSKM